VVLPFLRQSQILLPLHLCALQFSFFKSPPPRFLLQRQLQFAVVMDAGGVVEMNDGIDLHVHSPYRKIDGVLKLLPTHGTIAVCVDIKH
jgi:hypothetical protein